MQKIYILNDWLSPLLKQEKIIQSVLVQEHVHNTNEMTVQLTQTL